MRQKLYAILGQTGYTVRRYPMVLLMALLAAVSLMCFAQRNYNAGANNFVFVKFALVCCLGISLMFALKMLSQRVGRTTLLESAGVIFLVCFYFLLPEREQDFTEKYAFLVLPSFVLTHLLVSFVAFWGNGREMRFWEYNKNLFVNIFLTAVFTGVLTGGVELAVLAVDKLFDLDFSDRLYTQIFYFLAIFGSSFIFLLFNQKGLTHLEKESNYPQILKFFTQYVLVPLLMIYVVILYFYAGKILIYWELPRGWVSYLILAYSVVGILALLLVHPLKQDSTTSWVRLFSKIFYFSLSPLLILLFTAIFTRILEYGYTEPRYFVLLLSVWLTAVVLFFMLAKRATIKFIPISLFAFGLFSLAFPYLNTFSVSKRSQRNELTKILNGSKLFENGHIDFANAVSDTVAEEVSSKFNFLAQRGDSVFLMNILNKKDQKIIAKDFRNLNTSAIHGHIRNRFTNVTHTKSEQEFNRIEIFSERKMQNISDFDYILRFEDFFNDTRLKIGNDVISVSSRSDMRELRLKIVLNNKDSWDVVPFIRQTVRNNLNKNGRVEVPELSTENTLGKYRIKVVFSSIICDNIQRSQIYFNGGYILISRE